MSLRASWSVRGFGWAAARRFVKTTSDVRASQLDRLRTIVAANAGTEYGRRHGFASIRTLEDYRRQVPVIEYADIADLIDRVAAGESNVLTAESPIMFAMTSGTTGKPKLIPVTPTCRGRVHADLMRTWFYHALCDHPRMFAGKVVSLVSPAVEGHTPAGIPFGSTSGAVYRDMPAAIRTSYAVPHEVFEIEDYATKYHVIVLLALLQPVSFVCTANPSSILKLCEVADESAEELIRDIRDGTLHADADVSTHIRALLRSLLRADPDRARQLEEARARRGGRLLPRDYWPQLAMLACWKGGTVGSHIERLPAWFAPDEGDRMPPIRDWGYLSSEGRCSVPLTDEGAGGVLAVGSNVYEFAAAEEVAEHPDDPSRWTFLGAHEIEQPRDYHVFLTTTGGLYRYDINDVVRVVDRYQDAPVVQFVRKGRGMTSLTGEKLSVDQVLGAVAAAAEEVGVEFAHMRALAVVAECRYEFEIQPAADLDDAAAVRLLAAIDGRLSELNVEYAAKRNSLRLKDPLLHLMRPGWHDAIKGQSGARLFQAKTVVLRNEDRSAGADTRFRDRTIEMPGRGGG